MSAAPKFEIVSLGIDQVDRVEPLWKAMVAHHRELVGGEWPVRDEDDAWRRRRAVYLEWLAGEGIMLAAVPAGRGDGEPLGYAVLMTEPNGATWELGERIGAIESLAVAPATRGHGIGSALLEAARDRFAAAGIDYWNVEVVEANAGATALYERAGFQPFYRKLLGRVRD